MNNLKNTNEPCKEALKVEYEITREMRLMNENLDKLSDIIKSLRERCDDIIEHHPNPEEKDSSEKCDTVLGNSLKNFNEKLMNSIENLKNLHNSIKL